MASPEEIVQQRRLLEIHRDNLAVYLGQQAAFGLYAPPHVVTSITSERENIERVKGILREWGETVDDHPDDHPDDVAPPAETTRQANPAATSQIGRDQVSVQDSPGAITGSVSGDVTQNFGTQNTSSAGTVINIHGGDFRGSNLPIGNTVGGNLSQTGGYTTMSSAFNQPNWTVQGNVYNIAGDMNMSANPSKDEFLAALRQFKGEIDKAKDLPANRADEMKEDVDSAIKAIDKPQPNKERAVERLTTIQKILDGLKGSVGSALALGNLIGQVIQAAQGLGF
jgi:hypothetical protein